MAYNSAYTGSQIDEAVGAVREKEKTWDAKQDAITGTQGQIVGIGEDGNPVPQDTVPSHNQAAGTITAGTFAGAVVAGSSNQTPGTSLLRNSKLVSADTTPSNNGEIYWTYG